MSCAACHDPEQAFADGRRFSKGAHGNLLSRNTPALLNVGWFESFFWDGRAASLEEQALAPVRNPQEMDQDLSELARELAAIPGYARQFQQVFGGPPAPEGIAKALAAFQRTLVTPDSPFDRYLRGDEDALSDIQEEGLDSFRRNGCARCHNGPLLSDGGFYRLRFGLPDQGREAVTGKKADRFRFRTPTLRNVALTAPYFHDGLAPSLFGAVEFYFRRTVSPAPPGLELDFPPLAAQSYSEISAIVAFLESLTGETPEVSVPKLPPDP